LLLEVKSFPLRPHACSYINNVNIENGLDSLWADDFHHQVRVALAGDNESYFANFSGSTKDLADTIRKGWFFCGQPVPESGKPRGTDPTNAVSKLIHFCVRIATRWALVLHDD
jgi:hypothetical protein